MIEPGDNVTVIVGFLHDDMGHDRVGGGGAMPVLFDEVRDPPTSPGPDLDGFAAAAGDQAVN